MVASAYRHCLATETTDITTSEGRRADTVIDEDARLKLSNFQSET